MERSEGLGPALRQASRELAAAEGNLAELMIVYGRTPELALAADLAAEARRAVISTTYLVNAREGD